MGEWMVKIADQMDDEIDGAEEYMKCALKYKDTDRPTADIYFSMAQNEMTHYNHLSKMAESKAYELEDADSSIMNFIKNKYIDKQAHIRSLMAMYKE